MGRFTRRSTTTKITAPVADVTKQPQTSGEDQGRKKEVWKEKPRMRVDTDPSRSTRPSQSIERRPDRTVGCVGGSGDSGKTIDTAAAQKTMTGS